VRRFILFLLAAAVVALLFVRLGPRWGIGNSGGSRVAEKFTPAAAPPLEPGSLANLAALDSEYTRLIDSVVPAVVSVTSSRMVRVPVGDMTDRLFGWQGRVIEKPESSLGSGVFVSKEGHILTNHHVVAGMHDIQVQLTDGRSIPATLIGSDESVDIAVLRADVPDLLPLPLGDSDKVRVGQMVVAVGNPFGLQETVTRGIVSAKGRALQDSGVEFLQTDAAVNPGNSGGPLLNMRGEIIGINSAIYSRTGAWAGISFAIPANVARRTLESIIKTGRPVRGYLGLSMLPLTGALAREVGLPDARGVYVAEVVPGSPAQRAGIQPGDVVRSFNGRPINDANALRDRIVQAGVGAKVELGVIREGREQTVATEIAELPPTPVQPPAVQSPPAPRALTPPPPTSKAPAQRPANVLAGISVGPLPSTIRDNLPQEIAGVMVRQVEPNSPAGDKLLVGDIIEEVNKRPVPTVQDYEAVAQSISPGDRALLFICRGRTRAYVALSPE
jgi:serine protease Do